MTTPWPRRSVPSVSAVKASPGTWVRMDTTEDRTSLRSKETSAGSGRNSGLISGVGSVICSIVEYPNPKGKGEPAATVVIGRVGRVGGAHPLVGLMIWTTFSATV